MWQERQAELLREEIRALLAGLPGGADFSRLLEGPLAAAGRGLAGENGCRRPWPLLPLIVCEAISGHYERALPAASAIQFLMAAGDVFDDIEDADTPDSLSARYGTALANNAATTLLILAEKALTGLGARGVDAGTIVAVMDAVNSFYCIACAGQHLDLAHASETAIPEDLYLDVIEMKSASQIECACHAGALLAGAGPELVDTFARFGRNLGMAAQITNDINGIVLGHDIMKGKMTLPAIYALAQTEGDVHHRLEVAFGKQPGTAPDAATTKDLLVHSGALHYATIKMELYRQRAMDSLAEAERAGARVERLKLFLE